MPAITTMPNAIISVWFTPAMMLGMAKGRRMRAKRSKDVVPLARPSSRKLSGVCRMPRAVRRRAGGIATTTVAARAVAGPKPRSAIAGRR